MVRRSFAVLAVCATFLAVQLSTSPASAYNSIQGIWLIGGNARITTNFPNICQMNLNFPNVGLVSEIFCYNADKTFTDEWLAMDGTWTETSTGFTVNLKAWMEELRQQVECTFSEVIPDVSVTVTKQLFKGVVMSNKASSGTAEVDLLVTSKSLMLTGTVIFKATLTGVKLADEAAAAAAAASTAKDLKGPKAVAGALAERLFYPLKALPCR